MSSDQMPAPRKTKLIKFPPSWAGKDIKCPGYARGGMFKLRFDWYITMPQLGFHFFVHLVANKAEEKQETKYTFVWKLLA